MPIFEYACRKCEGVFEARVERADTPAPACPDCGAKRAKKLLSAFAVQGSSRSDFDAGGLPPCQGGTAPGCGMGACGIG